MVVLQPRLRAFAILGEAILQPTFGFPEPRRNCGHIEIIHWGAGGIISHLA
jgi:hypothetical protein